MSDQKIKLRVLEIDGFKVLHILTKPARVEAKVVLDRDNISQKLIFTLMEITHQYGFACSPPAFNGPTDPDMSFLVGSVVTRFSLKKVLGRMCMCLNDISNFLDDFTRQLDFSLIDVSMFGEVDIEQFSPIDIAAIRDQHYNGSWTDFKEALVDNNRIEEAKVIEKCVVFEKENNRDLGLVGHKLGLTLDMLEMQYQPNENTN